MFRKFVLSAAFAAGVLGSMQAPAAAPPSGDVIDLTQPVEILDWLFPGTAAEEAARGRRCRDACIAQYRSCNLQSPGINPECLDVLGACLSACPR